MIACLDTCALIWWTLDPDKLSATAMSQCNKIDQDGAIISSISIWEIGIKIKRNKLNINMPLERYIGGLKMLNLEIVPIDEEIWLESLELKWIHNDPADRVIIATAKKYDLPIITKDEEIRKFYKNVIS